MMDSLESESTTENSFVEIRLLAACLFEIIRYDERTNEKDYGQMLAGSRG